MTSVTPDQATLLAWELRVAVTSVALQCAGEAVGVEASVGVAILDEDVEGLDAVMARADAAMYACKRGERPATS